MTQEELTEVFKYIVKKCDMLINNGNYEADDYTQDTVEDIAELCNHILDGDYGKLVEVKEVDTWHLQEKENIYDAVKDWSLYTFACVMKDGTIQKFTGIMDEDCEGHINVHIDGANDDYDNVDDIVKWIEV